jgi:hypothetical protein
MYTPNNTGPLTCNQALNVGSVVIIEGHVGKKCSDVGKKEVHVGKIAVDVGISRKTLA